MSAIHSLDELGSRLREKLPALSQFYMVNTRLVLQTGVNLRSIKPMQNHDQKLIDRVLDALAQMGAELPRGSHELTANFSAQCVFVADRLGAGRLRDRARARRRVPRSRAALSFAGLAQDGAAIGGALQAQFPSTQVIGCSANGEFSDGHYGKGAWRRSRCTKTAWGRSRRCWRPLGGSAGGDRRCGAAAGEKLGRPLRSLDAQHFIGIGLLEGPPVGKRRSTKR